MKLTLFIFLSAFLADTAVAIESRRCDKSISSLAAIERGQKVVNDYFPRQWRVMKVQCFSEDGLVGFGDGFYPIHNVQRLVRKLGEVAVGDKVVAAYKGKAVVLNVVYITEKAKFHLSDGKWYDAFRIRRLPSEPK